MSNNSSANADQIVLNLLDGNINIKIGESNDKAGDIIVVKDK